MQDQGFSSMQGVVMTYRELDRRANQLAHRLVALGVGPEVPVGVMVPRCLDMVMALLGVLKAGGAYVPMDPSYPPDRLALMLEDSEVRLQSTSAHASVLCIEGWHVGQQEPNWCVDAGAGAAEPGEGACTSGDTHKGASAAGE